ncbi:SOS response-associated peptidase [Shinella sp. H4-D48]|uniref:SOS response-associated peptidase n=1 Tax=Shinella sp. H4-D48 TaxID=2925841 RepID=UPI001F5380CC|nr:SOS response-associated peptidase [Shinella sp. H4-D48]UNK36598.1 SOS response-associated peptidase [Shinella sp. H4-D48]
MLPWRELVALYRLTENIKSRNTEARFNVAPTQTVPFVRLDDEGNQTVDDGRWWLVPHWAKDMPKAAMFNARIETVDSSPAFREAFKTKRCLIPADGFYEWTKALDGGKDPWLIQMPGGAPYAFAGLWAHNTRMEAPVTSCTIITAPAVSPISQIHDRMPIILAPDEFDAWLNPATPVNDLKGILAHHLDGQMQMHRVSRDINRSKFTDRPAPIVNSL